ncbi:tRNA (5-methylaminomethyl-2-thiouridine)(34)-methyltransferase MnmD [Winogradskyella sp. F6397]|uniref:tRNA (5-methylaminomethyl-2-thiouridine)(34)-methyltransferase MnmD n=1 Tax=Winogradskyella marina TaxID=2785530 RepID=A0ABS0ELZ4_9FLAO|nr:tRNA (5-methylaminomethyl-2-thiouridine)(34)-methyltransferase MnmD [Winogradskyella marina]MBF8151484.1 tRNA (5-methylaminomethyl-2-thiouridine)(34)-methyltransferase MnmD [Winogradskyella marina]
MKRNIITTSDGSKTIQIEEWNEQYHSIHGAIQEANHVFLKHGLHFFFAELNSASPEMVSASKNEHKSQVENECHTELAEVSILEIGFGTGLNAFLTLIEAEKLNLNVNYVGVEAYPVQLEEIKQLNYIELISKEHEAVFEKLHDTPWEESCEITSNFQLEKQEKFFKNITAVNAFNIIYFDAFGARVQPDLWTEDIFKIMFKALKTNGILVTYSAKGSVRRAMQAVGFTVERLPGPPGKREMLRAQKKGL